MTNTMYVTEKLIKDQAAEIERLKVELARAIQVVADYDAELAKLRDAVESVDAHKVQCKCGWVGMTTELVRLDGKHECPACSTEFKALSAWPPLKSNACPKSDDGLHRPNIFSSPLSCSECNALLRAAR